MSKRPLDFKLYLITDRHLLTHHSVPITHNFFDAVEEALKGGAQAVQLREKDLEVRELLRMAYVLRELTSGYGAKLFINDRVDVAMAVNADGVHLGGSSMPALAARKAAGEGMLIGVSAHNVTEARKAEEEGADFVTLGPVFATPSKLKYGKPLGLALLMEVSAKISIPVFGIGGIKKEVVKDTLDSGASGIALISAILGSEDIKSNTEEFMRLLK
jgi:thiamine-phosphate pyrophosphorylase